MEINDNENQIKQDEQQSMNGGYALPSKQLYLFGNVFKVVSRGTIRDVTGRTLNRKEARDTIHTVLNTELRDNLVETIKENGEKQKEKEQKEGKEHNKFKKKYIVPIVLALMIPLVLNSCETKQTVKEQITITEEVPVDMPIYNLDNPSQTLAGIVGIAGQEEMTNNMIDGDTFEGEHYSSDEHAEAETQAVSGVVMFDTLKENIDLNVKILTSKSSSPEQREAAARTLLDLSQTAETMYQENEQLAQEYVNKFKEATLVNQDSNSSKEILATDLMLKSYLDSLGLSTENVTNLQNLVQLYDEGYSLEDISLAREKDGDYIISSNAVREVVKEQDVEKSMTLWQRMVNFVKGRSNEQER